jgi:mono/diheme cytochrome c family protein
MAALRAITCCLCIVTASALHAAGNPAGVENSDRARINYMLNCQGCHGPTGAGMADGTVPNMAGFVGRFLQVQGGREFLVRVPGSANAALDDASLAEVLNWMLGTMSPDELPARFRPYSAEEVGALRKSPLTEILQHRQRLLDAMRQDEH